MQIQIFNLMLRYMIRALPPRMIYCLVLSGAKDGYAYSLGTQCSPPGQRADRFTAYYKRFVFSKLRVPLR